MVEPYSHRQRVSLKVPSAHTLLSPTRWVMWKKSFIQRAKSGDWENRFVPSWCWLEWDTLLSHYMLRLVAYIVDSQYPQNSSTRPSFTITCSPPGSYFRVKSAAGVEKPSFNAPCSSALLPGSNKAPQLQRSTCAMWIRITEKARAVSVRCLRYFIAAECQEYFYSVTGWYLLGS